MFVYMYISKLALNYSFQSDITTHTHTYTQIHPYNPLRERAKQPWRREGGTKPRLQPPALFVTRTVVVVDVVYRRKTWGNNLK